LERNNPKDQDLKNLKRKYKKLKCWGLLASLDLRGCNPEYIRRPRKIKELIVGLCEFIKMKRYGEPMIKRFGSGNLLGYSAIQFIETSSVTLHFDEMKNRAFVEVFSCKYFEPKRVQQFCQKFLGARSSKLRYFLRH
jgi:S-adenosylmethionine/arginine decarboxylase-like enzyme